MRAPKPAFISFAPFSAELRAYDFPQFRNDLLAALAVALLTIPQSIAYSLLAGLPPTAGLFSAIFGSMLVAAFGSSRQLIAGPSTGVAILIQTSIADLLANYFETVTGPAKEALTLHILTQIVLIMGILQIASGFFNVSKLLQFVSRPVVLGYFAGITVAIAVAQVSYLFGVPSVAGGTLVSKAIFFVAHLTETNGAALVVGASSLGVLLFFRRHLRNWPDALFAILAASLIALAFHRGNSEFRVQTIQDLHLAAQPIPQLIMPLVDFNIINKVFPSAVAIAFLAVLEVFSISRNFASRSGQSVQINQDVFGLGLGNTALSFIAGTLPCSGSMTRTALNFRMSAKTRLAAVLSGLFTAVILYFCWPLVELIPLAGLAALLIATLPALTNFQELKLCFRATREDAWVFILTFLSCLIFSLEIAFFIGIVMSIATYLKKSSEPYLVEYAFNAKGRLMVVSPQEDVHRKVRIIGIGGELYFAAADFVQNAMADVIGDPNVEAVVLRLNNVHHMDASMCLALTRLHELLKAKGHYLIISGLTEEVWRVFHRAGLVKQVGVDNLYFTDESNPQFSTWKACLRAQELIHHRTH
ncbi:MAG TPA: SulP family inorganic anion transporter [Chlamydiales bacterium]|jgi:SulP family sulfate permease